MEPNPICNILLLRAIGYHLEKALSHFLDVVFSKTFFVGICREKKFSKIQRLRCETGPLDNAFGCNRQIGELRVYSRSALPPAQGLFYVPTRHT